MYTYRNKPLKGMNAVRELMIFSDSIMKGVIFENGKYRLCQGHDFSFLSSCGVNARNYAKMGATIKNGLAIMEKKLVPCGADTTVLLSFGGNDSDYRWQEIAAHPEDAHTPAVSEEEFVRLYREAVRIARESGAQVAAATLFPISPERYFETISCGKNAANIEKWLGDIAHLYRWQEYYSALVGRAARESGCRLIDLRAAFIRRDDLPQLICDDGIHPTQAGHDLIHDFLRQELCRS